MSGNHRLIATLLIVLQCLLLGNLSGQNGFGWLIALGSVVGLWVSIPIPLWAYVVLVGIGAPSIIVTTLSNPPVIQNDWILPGRFVVAISSSLLWVQLIELFRTKIGQPLSIRFSSTVLFSFLLAYCRTETVRNNSMFFLTAVSMAILLALLDSANKKSDHSDSNQSEHSASRGKGRWVVLAFALVFVAIGSNLLANTAKAATHFLRYMVTNEVAQSIETRNTIVAYASDGRLGGIATLKQTHSDLIALRGTCDVPPGYLRGRVFGNFDGKRWYDVSRLRSLDSMDREEIERRFPRLANLFRPDNSIQTFPISERNQGPFRSLLVTNEKSLAGKVFFTSHQTDFISVRSADVVLDEHHVIRNGFSTRLGYSLSVARDRAGARLSARQRKSLTQVPNSIQVSIGPLAAELCDGAQSTQEKITSIERFLTTKFEYSLLMPRSSSPTPLAEFVLDHRTGHCEYFASAAAMLLRLNSVPCRYVTGFTMTEPSESDDNSGELWVSRFQDAHAWLEVYEEEKQKWVIFEATPGVSVPKSVWEPGDRNIVTNSNADNGQRNSQSGGEFSFAKLIDWAWTLVSKSNQWIGSVTYVVMLVVLILLLRFYFREYSGFRTHYLQKAEARKLQAFDRKLKKLNLVRRPSETLHEFASRILSSDLSEEPWIQEAASEYQRYAILRYS